MRLFNTLKNSLIPYRWRELRWQLFQRSITEDDIHFFNLLEGQHGLVLDIGANRGQFALSLFHTNRSLHILSLEPNPELRWVLSGIKLLYPLRFRFLLRGAGEHVAQQTLHIPVTPQCDLSANASLVPQEFEKDYVKKRLSDYAKAADGHYRFTTKTVHIIPIDQLKLAPLVVKIDVEGYELSTLKGMEQTLTRHHPLLMIEMNNQELFMPWLAAKGYRFYRYDQQQRQLISYRADHPILNVFCLHPHSPQSILKHLAPEAS